MVISDVWPTRLTSRISWCWLVIWIVFDIRSLASYFFNLDCEVCETTVKPAIFGLWNKRHFSITSDVGPYQGIVSECSIILNLHLERNFDHACKFGAAEVYLVFSVKVSYHDWQAEMNTRKKSLWRISKPIRVSLVQWLNEQLELFPTRWNY